MTNSALSHFEKKSDVRRREKNDLKRRILKENKMNNELLNNKSRAYKRPLKTKEEIEYVPLPTFARPNNVLFSRLCWNQQCRSYQVSGIPYMTGSDALGNGTEHKHLFPLVTKKISVLIMDQRISEFILSLRIEVLFTQNITILLFRAAMLMP